MEYPDNPLSGPFPVLVIGCGSIGRRHIRNLLSLGAGPVYAYDVREDRRDEISSQFGIEVFDDLGRAFENHGRAAIICSPTSLHLEHALMAARKGYHIFIEKPISDSLDGTGALIREAENRGLVTLVGCNFRFHPGLRKVKELLTSGTIGHIVSARAQFGQYLPDWHPWEDYRLMYSARKQLGGGVVLDRIHEIDYIRWLLGEITDVSAFVGKVSDLEIETADLAEILFRHADGAVTSLHLDYIRRAYDASCEVVGEDGIIQWSFSDKTVRWFSSDRKTWQSFESPEYDTNQMYLDEIRHFLNCIAGKENPELSAADGARVLAVALAVKQASQKKEWVHI